MVENGRAGIADADDVLLVGGSTLLPRVFARIEERFERRGCARGSRSRRPPTGAPASPPNASARSISDLVARRERMREEPVVRLV
jgi:molecular chaperone DnaK (HSP70)